MESRYEPFDITRAQELLRTIGASDYDPARLADKINVAYAVLVDIESEPDAYQPSKIREHFASMTKATSRLNSMLANTKGFCFTEMTNSARALHKAGNLPRSNESVRITSVPPMAASESDESGGAFEVPELGEWLLDLQGRLRVLEMLAAKSRDRTGQRAVNDSPGVDANRAYFYLALLFEYQQALAVTGKFTGFRKAPRTQGAYASCPEVEFLVSIVLRCPLEHRRILEGGKIRRRGAPTHPRGPRDEIYPAVAKLYDRLVQRDDFSL